MKTPQRNVSLDRHPASVGNRRLLERLLLSNRYINKTLAWSAQLTLTGLIWPRFVAPFDWQLTRHALPLAGLAPAFQGYKILHLTDLHVGRSRVSYLMQAIERSLAEKPDLIVITGDLIDYHPRALAPLKKILQRIVTSAGADGVLAIFGNHDYHEYSWRHIGPRAARRSIHRRLVEIVQSTGIQLLRNEHVRITRDGLGTGDLVVVGIDEMWTGLADAAAAFQDVSPTDAVLCLQHNPDGVEFLMNHPWQFMLCGHSHGGQALFPGLGALYVPMKHRQYLQGFFPFPPLAGQPPTVRQRTMFVSRGLGYSTPIRLRCRPEVTLFTVEAGPSHSPSEPRP